MEKNFQTLLDRMKQEEKNWDQEGRHVHADDILVESLKLLSEGTEYQSVIQEICDCYEGMDFWYA